MDLGTLTNARLVKELERRQKVRDQATKAVFDLALHGHERFMDILARIGGDHLATIAYNYADREFYEAFYEAQRRVGQVRYAYEAILFLEKSPRYKRIRS